MKIFEINWVSQNETEWVAAHTNIQAIKILCNASELTINDFEDTDEIIEVPEEKWNKMFIINEDNQKQTFQEWMNENTEPCIIAGTFYL